jgi:hypothetical protein
MSLIATVADQQIAAATAATLSFQGTDSEGEPADPGTVTVGVVNSAGTVVLAPLTATSGATTSPRTVALTASQTANVDQLTATWTASGVVVGVTVHEVIGRVLITKAEFETREAKASGVSTVKFLAARKHVDATFMRIARRGFTPRFAVQQIESRGRRVLPLRFPDLLEVRWANHIDTSGTVTAIDVSDVRPNSSGLAALDDYWECGTIEIGYVHGMARAPFDVVDAAATYLRYTLGSGSTTIPQRATTYSDGQGGTTQLATPGLGPFETGIPDVDKTLLDHQWNVPGIA